MSKYPPNDYDEPYIGDPLPMGEARPLSEYEAGFQDGYETAAARIAELEAERADYITETEALVVRVRGESAARIGELEDERDRMQGYADEETDARDNAERLRRVAEDRIVELEALIELGCEAVHGALQMVESDDGPPNWDSLRRVRTKLRAAIHARPAP